MPDSHKPIETSCSYTHEDEPLSPASNAHQEKTIRTPQEAPKYHLDHHGTMQGQVVGDYNTVELHFHGTEDKTASSMKAKQVWNLPYQRNDYFTGREEILTQLHTRFRTAQASSLSQRQAISGLGGIGKTQIAVQYSYKYSGDYQAVLWAFAKSQETLISSFIEIAAHLDLTQKDAQDQTLTIKAVKRWLQDNKKWLLILDNADEPAIVYEFLPTNFDGHILLTTRAQALGGLALPTEVDTFTRATASKDVDYRERGERGYEEISERKCVELKHFRRLLCEKGFEQVE